MARYIKANQKVAAFLKLTSDRNTVKDGNYILWQNDMLAFGPLTQLPDTLKKIGGIALLAHEAREEQDGTVSRPLPVAEDPRFVIETAQANTAAVSAETDDAGTTDAAAAETAAEATAEAEAATGESEQTNEEAAAGEAAEEETTTKKK